MYIHKDFFKRIIFRYTVLTIVEALRQISCKIKKRFPKHCHLVKAGIMTQSELKAMERAQKMTDYPCYWIPINWAGNIAQQAYQQGYIKEVGFLLNIVEKMSSVNKKCREVYSYSFTCFPLVYTQVKQIFFKL